MTRKWNREPKRKMYAAEIAASSIGDLYDKPINRPIGLKRNGEVEVVLVPATEYAQLTRLASDYLRSDSIAKRLEFAARNLPPIPDFDE